jgi:putative ABC transport system permease protein
LLTGILSVVDSGLIQGSINALLALGVVITLLSLDFPDLSIEGTFPFGAAVGAALLVDAHLHPIFVLPLAFLGGACAGSITGILHVRFQMSKLLSGISVAAMLYSGSLLAMRGRGNTALLGTRTVFGPFEKLDGMASAAIGRLGVFLHPGTLLAVAAVAVLVLFSINRLLQSEFGVILRGVGMNEPALRHYGRSSGPFKIVGLAIGNGLAAVAGALSAQYSGFADVGMGVGVLASSLIGVVLGQELFSRLGWGLDRPAQVTAAAVFGAIVYQVLLNGVLTMGAPPTAIRFLSGFALVLVIVLGRRRLEVSSAW